MKKLVSLFNPTVSNIGSFENFLAQNDIGSIQVSLNEEVTTSTLVICGVSGLSLDDKKYMISLKKWLSGLNERNVKIIGICAGMQMFFSYTEESSNDLLGFLNGNVQKLDFEPEFTKTFIGYRELLIPGLNISDKAYFSHGYGITQFSIADFKNCLVVELSSGQSFLAYFESENIFGFQFHPEKSHQKWRNFFISKL